MTYWIGLGVVAVSTSFFFALDFTFDFSDKATLSRFLLVADFPEVFIALALFLLLAGFLDTLSTDFIACDFPIKKQGD